MIAYSNKGGMFAGLSFMVLIFVASFVEMQNWIRVLLIAFGLVTFVVGLHNALRIEQTAGYYERGKCHYKYIPTYSSRHGDVAFVYKMKTVFIL